MYRLGMRPSQGEAHQEHLKAHFVVSSHTLHFTVCSTVVHLNLSKFNLKNRKKIQAQKFYKHTRKSMTRKAKAG